jgi:hypothetical protein
MHVSDLLVPPGTDLDADRPSPATTTTADPSELRAVVQQYLGVTDASAHMRPWFRRLLRVGPYMIVCLAVGVVAVAMAFSYFAGFSRARTVGYVGAGLAAVAALGVAAVWIFYVYLQEKLGTAEILSNSELAE